jgi:hypothetical protein
MTSSDVWQVLDVLVRLGYVAKGVYDSFQEDGLPLDLAKLNEAVGPVVDINALAEDRKRAITAGGESLGGIIDERHIEALGRARVGLSLDPSDGALMAELRSILRTRLVVR